MYLGGGFEQLKVDLDLHHIAEGDDIDARRHGEVDAEVLAADLGCRFEAGVAGAAREGFDAAKLDGQHDRTGDVADGQITVDLVLRSGPLTRVERNTMVGRLATSMSSGEST